MVAHAHTHTQRLVRECVCDALVCLSAQVCNKREKHLSDPILEKYIINVVFDTISAFFSSPFSENSTSLQVRTAMNHVTHGLSGSSAPHTQSIDQSIEEDEFFPSSINTQNLISPWWMVAV